MSDTAYTKYNDVAEDDSGEPYEDEETEVYEGTGAAYAEEYGDEEPLEAQPVGLFSTPVRAITMIFSVLLLFVVVGVLAWLLGQSGKKNVAAITTGSNIPPVAGSLTPVPEINDANALYDNKPAGLSEAPKVGALPPNFQWTDPKTKQPVKLSSLRGKPVLLNFWGTWCPPCRAEMPEMQKIYDRMGKDVVFLGVSMGPRDEPLGVSQFVVLNKYTWDFIHDPDSAVMNRYQVTGIPSSYFIDKSGVIRAIHVGGADAQILEANLQKAQQ